MKVYGIEIREDYVRRGYDSNQSDYYFDTTRVYTSKQTAREQMKKLASIEYKKIIEARGASPTMTYYHNSDIIDVGAAYYNHRSDVSIHYEVVEMELDEDE